MFIQKKKKRRGDSILSFMIQIYCWWILDKTEIKIILLLRNCLPKDTKNLHLGTSTPECNFIPPDEGEKKVLSFSRKSKCNAQ